MLFVQCIFRLWKHNVLKSWIIFYYILLVLPHHVLWWQHMYDYLCTNSYTQFGCVHVFHIRFFDISDLLIQWCLECKNQIWIEEELKDFEDRPIKRILIGIYVKASRLELMDGWKVEQDTFRWYGARRYLNLHNEIIWSCCLRTYLVLWSLYPRYPCIPYA